MSKKPTVKTIYNWLDEAAPFLDQEEFDNAGFQVGRMEQEVNGVLLCLDVTEEVILEAVEKNANLIIAHHPLIFSPLRSMDEQRHPQGLLASLIRNDISLIATHTNIDKSWDYSGSAALAKLLMLQDVRKAGEYLFIGELPQPMQTDELKMHLQKVLENPVLCFQNGEKTIRTLAVAGGSYSEGFQDAQAAGADALLTGEVRHHHAVEAAQAGFPLYEGGHFSTEAPMLAALLEGLQTAMNQLNYNLQVYQSQSRPYGLC